MRLLTRANQSRRHLRLSLQNFIVGRRLKHDDSKPKSIEGLSPDPVPAPTKRVPLYRYRLLPFGILTSVFGAAYIYHHSRDVANAKAEDTYTITLLDNIDSGNVKKPLAI